MTTERTSRRPRRKLLQVAALGATAAVALGCGGKTDDKHAVGSVVTDSGATNVMGKSSLDAGADTGVGIIDAGGFEAGSLVDTGFPEIDDAGIEVDTGGPVGDSIGDAGPLGTEVSDAGTSSAEAGPQDSATNAGEGGENG